MKKAQSGLHKDARPQDATPDKANWKDEDIDSKDVNGAH